MGITVFCALLLVFPNFGYVGEADVSVERTDRLGYQYVRADVDLTYNPLLYSLSWLTGNGHFSGPYLFVSKPIFESGGLGLRPRRKRPSEIGQEVISSLVSRQFSVNVVGNFIILLLIKLMKMQDLYLCLIVGTIGFVAGGFIGAIFGFLVALLAIAFVMLRLKKGNEVSTRILNYVFEKHVYEKV